MSAVRSRQAAGTPTGGQFATETRTEPDIVLDREGLHIERMVAARALSPAARDMDPREALDQWAQANAATLREHATQLEAAGLRSRLAARDLVPGDVITHDGQDWTVSEVFRGPDVTLWVENDSADRAHRMQLEPEVVVEASITGNEDRCSACGEDNTGGEGWDGYCGTCADRREDEEAGRCDRCSRPLTYAQVADGYCSDCED